jgi:hypothetical protein
MGVSRQQDKVGSFALYFCCAVCTARLSSLANYRVSNQVCTKNVIMCLCLYRPLGIFHAIAWITFIQFFKAMCYFLLLVNSFNHYDCSCLLFCDVLCSSIGLRLIGLPVHCQAQ